MTPAQYGYHPCPTCGVLAREDWPHDGPLHKPGFCERAKPEMERIATEQFLAQFTPPTSGALAEARAVFERSRKPTDTRDTRVHQTSGNGPQAVCGAPMVLHPGEVVTCLSCLSIMAMWPPNDPFPYVEPKPDAPAAPAVDVDALWAGT